MRQHSRFAVRSPSVWAELVRSYNAARLVIAASATVSAAIVGAINDWPRGPWVLLVALAVTTHALVWHMRPSGSVTFLLLIDLVALAMTSFLMGIPTIALITLAFVMISAAVLEVGARVYLLWALDIALIGLAFFLASIVALPDYTAEQAALSEVVGLVFFALATVAMTRTLVNRLRRIDLERRATAEKLSDHDSRYRAMLAYSSDGLAVTDAGLRVLEVGVQNERLTGYRPEERIGGSILDLVVDDDRGTLLEAYNKVVREPRHPARFDVRIRRSDGETRLMSATVRNLLDDVVLEGFVFNFHDVTEEHELRRSLELFGISPE